MEQTQAGPHIQDLGRKLPVDIGEEHKNMPLINLVITLIVVGMLLWLINRFIPMASSIKTILNVVVVVFVGIWVLQAVGLWGDVSTFRIGR
jgi:predicted membrane protein